MRRHRLALAAFVATALAACDNQGGGNSLDQAAAQSDPAAANVLAGSADNGTDPQQALEQAGQAAANGTAANMTTTNSAAPPATSLQARPNLPQSPNRKDGTQAPDKTVANAQ